MISSIVSSKWLNENLQDENLIILDASTAKNASGKQTKHKHKTIPNARFFDLKNVFSEQNADFPNTFPSVGQFENGCRTLGINNSSRIVVYDNLGIYTSPRVRWMFKTMGHKNIAVLNGGLPDWIENGFDTHNKHDSTYEQGNFTCNFDSTQIVNLDVIEVNISKQDHLVIDARSEGRFNGTIKESRPGLRSGHIPKSINIPFEDLLKNGKFKSETELKQLFGKINGDERPLIFSCGSGITACIVLLASELVLKNPTSIYDGSWTEWGFLK